MKQGYKDIFKVVGRIIGIALVLCKIALIIVIGGICIIICFDKDAGKPVYSREMAVSPIYKNGEDLYKLTGVRFPEVTLVDSVFFEDGGFPTGAWWNEYKFVAKDGMKKDFFRKLDKACKEDSTHWSLTESGYGYYIHPDRDTVDRTKGMCDRMVKKEDGSLVPDWDGSFISVDIENDTIYLKQGWVR